MEETKQILEPDILNEFKGAAISSYRNTSFSPERRGENMIKEFSEELTGDMAELKSANVSDESIEEYGAKRKGYLKPENCNKAKCKTCIFNTDGNQVELAPGRLNEIKSYLIGKSSHICHTTQKTCFGGLQWQAQIFYRMGWIKEESVECLLLTANKLLDGKKV